MGHHGHANAPKSTWNLLWGSMEFGKARNWLGQLSELIGIAWPSPPFP